MYAPGSTKELISSLRCKFWAERQNGDKKILRLLGCDPPIGAATAYAAKIQSDRVLPMGSENAVQDFGVQRRYICNGGSSVWYNPTQPPFDAPAVLTGSQPSRATLCTSGCAQGSSRNSKLHGISAPRQGSFSARCPTRPGSSECTSACKFPSYLSL